MKRSEAGRGGRKGHSNMAHHDRTAVVKTTAKKIRRANDRIAAREDA